MKLAEALILRADIIAKISDLKTRLINNSRYQEGAEVVETPESLFEQLNACFPQLEKIIERINRTNSSTLIGKKTIAELIVEKDCIAKKHKIYKEFCDSASGENAKRYSRSEIIERPSTDIPTVRKQVDLLAKQYRELDNKLQAANWNTDLVE